MRALAVNSDYTSSDADVTFCQQEPTGAAACRSSLPSLPPQGSLTPPTDVPTRLNAKIPRPVFRELKPQIPVLTTIWVRKSWASCLRFVMSIHLKIIHSGSPFLHTRLHNWTPGWKPFTWICQFFFSHKRGTKYLYWSQNFLSAISLELKFLFSLYVYSLILGHVSSLALSSVVFSSPPCMPHAPPLNRLTPNDPYMGRTAPLTSKCCILYIYSTNIGTEYFKHALYSPFFLFKIQFVS